MDKWCWQLPTWPSFNYNPNVIQDLERQFIANAGFLLGAYQHSNPIDQEQLKIDLVSEEAVETSAIEGEMLDRASVQASLRRNFGLSGEKNRKLPALEQGIAHIMADLYQNYSQPLSNDLLFKWHLNLVGHRIDLDAIGNYRYHDEPMQIISGSVGSPKVHYEAPSSAAMTFEMGRYINWFNTSINMPILTRAAVAHLYFELIHPFEDGNGRIGRALVNKAIAQSFGEPLLLAFSRIIQKNKKQYYAQLEAHNRKLEINDWLEYFAKLMLESQNYTKDYIEFLSAKTRLYDKFMDKLNERQAKAIARIFKQGIDGFEGGLSAENYIAITKASRATATRDLQDLVAKNIMHKTGELKSTRYHLNLVF